MFGDFDEWVAGLVLVYGFFKCVFALLVLLLGHLLDWKAQSEDEYDKDVEEY